VKSSITGNAEEEGRCGEIRNVVGYVIVPGFQLEGGYALMRAG
jgi:hypothetical protein